jgi:hypothetical protein
MPITTRDNGTDKEFEEAIRRAEKKAKGNAPQTEEAKSLTDEEIEALTDDLNEAALHSVTP